MAFSRAVQRALTDGGAVAVVSKALALPASAHVTVNPNTAEPGGYGAFDVRVPNEETGADTTKVESYLPNDHPVASVSVQPTPGWTVEVTKGTLPKPIKTDDGEVTKKDSVVRWIEMPSGGAEPEHPAPSIRLAKTAAPQAAKAVKTGGTGTAKTLGVLGLVAGLLGLVIAIVAFVRSGRSAAA